MWANSAFNYKVCPSFLTYYGIPKSGSLFLLSVLKSVNTSSSDIVESGLSMGYHQGLTTIKVGLLGLLMYFLYLVSHSLSLQMLIPTHCIQFSLFTKSIFNKTEGPITILMSIFWVNRPFIAMIIF